MVWWPHGIPLATLLTAANVNDSLVFEQVLEAIPPIRRRRGAPGQPRRRLAKLHADKGYDERHCRRYCTRRHIACRIARIGIESSERLGRHRWLVERTGARFNRFRRLRIRDERRADIHAAFISLAAALILFGYLRRYYRSARAAIWADLRARTWRTMRYYQLQDDIGHPNRWFLQAPVDPTGAELDPRLFADGAPVAVAGPLTVRVRRAGHPLDFTLADFGMPVVRRAIGEILGQIAPRDVQRIPVRVHGSEAQYEILNVVTRRHAIDERRSVITRWTEADGRPDKLGQYFLVSRLAIEPEAAAGAGIFRLSGWEIAVVVSDAVRRALLAHEVTGVKFAVV